MSKASAETEAIIHELDQDPDLEVLRRRIAALISRLLTDDSRPLTLSEKMHYEMAIALLPTVWLRLCLTHLRMAQEQPEAEVAAEIEQSRGAEFEALTRNTLVDRLGQARRA